MKHKILLPILMFLSVCFQVNAQKTASLVYYPWIGNSVVLSSQQKVLLDSLVDGLIPGTSIKVDVLSPAEKALPENERGVISYDRIKLLMNYCAQKKLPLSEYHAEMVPFRLPNTLRTNDLTAAAYRPYRVRAQTYLVLIRPELKLSSNPAVNFDASVDKDIQQFKFDPNEEMYAYLSSGNSVFIPGGSLRTSNGGNPDCDTVVLHIAEYTDMAAMAMKAMTTTSSGKKLNTAGMFYIQATCNGKPLVMATGEYYVIKINAYKVVPGMRVFTGQMKSGMLNWKEETDGKVTTYGLDENNYENERDSTRFLPNLDVDQEWDGNREGDGNYESPGYSLQLNDFGWINCDAFDETQTLTDFMVRGEINEETSVMLVYTGRKSILPGYLAQDGRTVVFSNIAADEAAMLVVYKMDKKKGTAEKFTKMIMPGTDKSISVALTKSTIDELRAEVKTTLADY